MANVAKLSERERISLLMIRGWGDRERSYDQVRLLFNETFRNGDGLNHISKSTVERTIRRFVGQGTVKDLQKCGRPRTVATEEMQLHIAHHLLRIRILVYVEQVTSMMFLMKQCEKS